MWNKASFRAFSGLMLTHEAFHSYTHNANVVNIAILRCHSASHHNSAKYISLHSILTLVPRISYMLHPTREARESNSIDHTVLVTCVYYCNSNARHQLPKHM